jgi:hypothetical protein
MNAHVAGPSEQLVSTEKPPKKPRQHRPQHEAQHYGKNPRFWGREANNIARVVSLNPPARAEVTRYRDHFEDGPLLNRGMANHFIAIAAQSFWDEYLKYRDHGTRITKRTVQHIWTTHSI